MARFVQLTLQDGSVIDGILLSPSADTGEGASTPLVVPLDRGWGVGAPIAANPGDGPDTYVEAV